MGAAYRYPTNVSLLFPPVIGPQTILVSVPTTPNGSLRQVPAVVNATCYAGDDFSFELPVYNPDGSDTDLTGATVLAHMRQTLEDVAPIATLASAIAGNIITLTLAGTDSQALVGPYLWDCQVTYGDGKISTIAGGTISIVKDVSHA
jgi:hypothetical protein